jgi:hypothetical protein
MIYWLNLRLRLCYKCERDCREWDQNLDLLILSYFCVQIVSDPLFAYMKCYRWPYRTVQGWSTGVCSTAVLQTPDFPRYYSEKGLKYDGDAAVFLVMLYNICLDLAFSYMI